MFLARPFAAAVTASLLIAGTFSVFLLSVVDSRAQGPLGICEDAAGLAVLPSPVAPWKGAPLRVIFAAEKPLEGELSLIAPDGSVAAKSRERQGGPPYFWFAEVASPAAGTWHAVREQLASCAVAETVDGFLIRPGCLVGAAWLLRSLPGGVWLGFVLGKAAADVAWYGLEASARRGVRIVGRGVITRPVRDHEKIPA